MSDSFFSLFAELRAAGLPVTPLQTQQAMLVLARAQADNPQVLERIFASIILKSDDRAARALLRQTLTAWAARQSGPGVVGPVGSEGLEKPVHAIRKSMHPNRRERLRAQLRKLGPRLWGRGPRRTDRQAASWLRRGAWAAAAVAVGVALLLLLRALAPAQPPEPTPAPPDMTQLEAPDLGPPRCSDGGLAEDFVADVPKLIVVPAVLPPGFYAGLGYSAAALLLAGVLFALRRRGLLSVPTAAAPRPGGAERVLPGAVGAGRLLLSAPQEDALVWGVGRAQSGDPTPHLDLDLDRTVTATAAAAGCVTPRYQFGRYQREVLLWEDRATAVRPYGPLVRRLADEIAAALMRAGLVVERATFLGVPDKLHGEHGTLYPGDLEDRREGTVVLLFTDGRALTQRLADERRRAATRALLRALAAWPRLALVDFSGGAHNLAEHAAPFDLPVLTPAQAAAFLGFDEAPSVRVTDVEEKTGDEASLDLWEAALALAPFPVSEESALQLAQALAKELGGGSPYDLALLRGRHPNGAGRLCVSAAVRAQRLRPLVAGLSATLPLPERLRGTPIALALRHFQREVAAARGKLPASAQGSLAALRLDLAEALLRLWDDPRAALPILLKLHGPPNPGAPPGPLYKEVRGALRTLVPTGSDRPARPRTRPVKDTVEATPLPWQVSEVPAYVLARLKQMELGQAAGLKPDSQVRPPARRAAALALLLSFVGGAVLWSGVAVLKDRRGFALQLPAAPPLGLWTGLWRARLISSLDEGLQSKVLVIGTARTMTTAADPQKMEVRVVMQRQVLPCREAMSGAELWRCGTLRDSSRPAKSGWPQQQVVRLAYPAEDPRARALATVLLDSGSADAVLLGLGLNSGTPWLWRGLEPILPGQAAPRRTVFRVADDPQAEVPASPAELPALVEALRFAGDRPLEDVWPRAQAGTGLRLIGSGGPAGCPYREETIGDQVYVYVCGGEFTMGSGPVSADKQAYDDNEEPPHRVRISDFWMHKYEVSRAQFYAFAQRQNLRDWQQTHSGKGSDGKPAAEMTWAEARAFCQSSSGDLPTEAEWEFAARGEQNRLYPWGSNAPNERLANFRSKEADPVTTHHEGQGPFGTFNQAGNVWEWVRDCWSDNYNNRRRDPVIVNPTFDNCPVDTGRVLRGGSFNDEEWVLRSAFRGRGNGSRLEDIGFRCVRPPRR